MNTVKEQIDNEQSTTGMRGLFRRKNRANRSNSDDRSHDEESREEPMDAIARHMDNLNSERTNQETDVRTELNLQRAAIARANQQSTSTDHPTPSPATPNLEFPMADAHQTTHDDIEARLEAVLSPSPVEQPSQHIGQPAEFNFVEPAPESTPAPVAPVAAAPVATTPVQAPQPEPVPHTAPIQPQPAAESGAPTATRLLGIDVNRMVSLLEDEARAAQHRIELEIRSAHTQASEIVTRAEGEAERIREHGQAQARVLLGEVEEIISEAQATGEQILLRANEESASLRSEATAVMHKSQSEARAIIETARREGEQVLAEQRRLATVRAQEAMREQDRLKDQIRRLEERRRQVLESLEPLIAQLTQMMPQTDIAGTPVNQSEPAANLVHLENHR